HALRIAADDRHREDARALADHGGEETTLTVGANCTIREGVTMKNGTADFGGQKIVGDNNLFLANSHVAHDCRVGNHV
ncbi:hypothetical protein ACC719_36790, partial [Rhizobium ruizarguesonis]